MPGFKITLPLLHKGLYAILYGRSHHAPAQSVPPLRNRCRHGRGTRGRVGAPVGGGDDLGRLRYRDVKATYRRIIADFAAIDGVGARRTAPGKLKVGIVGEIFVKFSALGNNQLEKFLISEGAEPVMGGLVDFFLYSITDSIMDYKLYGLRFFKSIYKIAYRFFLHKQDDLIRAIRENDLFTPPTSFRHTATTDRATWYGHENG